MATRILKSKQMEGLVDVEELVDPMEEAYRELGEGQATAHRRQRSYVTLEEEPHEKVYWFNNIMGSVPSRDVFALRIDSDHCVYTDDRMVFPADHYTGLVLLFDIPSTDLVAIMDDHFLSPLRVGATSAVFARHLMRDGASRLGLYGTGEQADSHVRTLQHVGGFDEVVVYSPTEANREAFAARHDESMDADVRPVDDPAAVVEGADVVVTATNANQPVFDGEWLEPGTTVISIVGGDAKDGRTELDATTVRRADQLFTNRREQLVHDRQGNVYDLIAAGEVDLEDIAELSELVTGARPGRASDDEVLVVKNNTGLGHQFAVTGSLIRDRAEAEDAGFVIPHEWFTIDRDGVWSP